MFSVKKQVVNILGFMGHIWSLSQLSNSMILAQKQPLVIHKQYVNKYGYASIKYCLNKQVIWPIDHSLQTLDLYICKIGRMNTYGSLAISVS